MFRATYLGHHSWLFSSGGSSLLVDPIFTDRFGFTDSVELRLYPPRRLELGAFPAVDAVFLTHEHEGHFELPSLNALDREIPIYIPARSSLAMRQAITELGFELRLLNPGEPLSIGGLQLLPMTADQVNNGVIDEWDVLPYLVWDRAGHGSLFTNVDMRATEGMRRLAQGVLGRPGLWAHTTNHSQWNFQASWLSPDEAGLRDWVRRVIDYQERLAVEWTEPEALLVVGGGWCYGGELAWLNHNAFPFENTEAAAILSALLPKRRVEAPLPGDTLQMREGRLVEISRAGFVAALPREEWPGRQYRRDVAWLQSYGPACGRRELPEEELPALEVALDELAAHLYARELFRRLYSRSAEELRGRKPTLALALLADVEGGAWVYEYEPQGCRFTPVESADPASEYLAVYECWATDLLATLRAEISPSALGFGRSREWNANPEVLSVNFNVVLFEHAHPLRYPARFLALYQRTAAALAAPPQHIRAGPGGHEADASQAQKREP
jgi:hypothetical protein